MDEKLQLFRKEFNVRFWRRAQTVRGRAARSILAHSDFSLFVFSYPSANAIPRTHERYDCCCNGKDRVTFGEIEP